MRAFASLLLQLTGMTLPAVGLTYGLTHDRGMGIELALLFTGLALFWTGRLLQPADQGP